MKIEYRPIADVKPYPGNPTIDADAIAAVAWSICEVGFVNPIHVDERGEVVFGHIRLAAARSLGMTKVPVVVCDKMSPDRVRALRIADCQTPHLSARRKGSVLAACSPRREEYSYAG